MAEPWKHQVSLRGSSAKEITRDALLQKVSKERELRNFSRRASAAALFIQRVWRRYNVVKKVAVEVREEWEALVNHPNVPITRTWVSSSLLRPFLFFMTCPSFAHQKQQPANRRCMLTCFKILLQSINSTDSQKNFCCLATGALVERHRWLHQAQRLILICLSLLAEFNCFSPVGQDTDILTSLAMRIMVALTDLKGWKCVTDENLRDAVIAVKDLNKRIATGKHHLYFCIRSYFIKLDSHIYPQRNCALQTDDHFLVTASAITIAVRPFQVGQSDVNTAVHVEVQDALEQYCIYLLSVPWLFQRLPTILRPALKHKSVLSPCLKTLLISKEKIFLKMSMLDPSGFSSKKIPSVGWALANIINLATECENDNLDAGKISEGINCGVYVHVVTIVAERLLDWLESVEHAKKKHDCVENANALIETANPDIWERERTFGSLKLSYRDLLRPVFQPWHLMVLLAMTKKESSIQISDTSPYTSLEELEKLKLLDIAHLYSYILRILAILDPTTGSLPLLNMLSFTPGFLLDLWGALEGAIFIGSHTPVNRRSCTGGTSNGQSDGSCEKKSKWASKDAGNKWASVLQKISRKSPMNVEYEDSVNEPPGDSHISDDSSDLWDVEPFKRGLQGMSNDIACMLHLFCSTYSHLLLVLDDIEFYEKQAPFTLEQQRRITSMLNTLVYNGFSHNNHRENIPLMDAAVRCLHLLYERDCRRQFCPPHLWLSPARKNRPPIAAAARAHEAISVFPRSEDALTSPGMGSVITVTPHVFPFEERVQMFREFIKLDKVSRRMAGEVVGPGPGSIEIVIRRGHIVEDGFKQLNNLGSKLKSCIHVSFVSECGLPEAGLDYGGLSKEFLTDISKTAFDPDYGLFSQTSTSERHIIPNVSARLIENGIQMIEFVGRIVGKALYEGILLDYSFSHVFVQKLLGRYSFLDELSTLDPELYRNLMYVKDSRTPLRPAWQNLDITPPVAKSTPVFSDKDPVYRIDRRTNQLVADNTSIPPQVSRATGKKQDITTEGTNVRAELHAVQAQMTEMMQLLQGKQQRTGTLSDSEGATVGKYIHPNRRRTLDSESEAEEPRDTTDLITPGSMTITDFERVVKGLQKVFTTDQKITILEFSGDSNDDAWTDWVLKHYDGEVKELSLDFTVTDEYLGKHVVTELKPGGKDVAVTNENKLQYIHAIADYKLNRQILPLANAFYRGLIDLISPSWLSLFNAGEFNQLLSGGNYDIDVDDLRNNTRYTGGYSGGSRTVKIFWEVLTGFEPKERCMLLKFVTSCSRAPLLGFKHLQPAFTIHKVSCSVPLWATIGGQDVDRLPSASTCYNTLKLPTYKRAITMKAKLLYAISSNAGFELS